MQVTLHLILLRTLQILLKYLNLFLYWDFLKITLVDVLPFVQLEFTKDFVQCLDLDFHFNQFICLLVDYKQGEEYFKMIMVLALENQISKVETTITQDTQE